MAEYDGREHPSRDTDDPPHAAGLHIDYLDDVSIEHSGAGLHGGAREGAGRPAAPNVITSDGRGLLEAMRRSALQLGRNRATAAICIRRSEPAEIFPNPVGTVSFQDAEDQELEMTPFLATLPGLLGLQSGWLPLGSDEQDALRAAISTEFRRRKPSRPDRLGEVVPWHMSRDRWHGALQWAARHCQFHPLDDWIAERSTEAEALPRAPHDPAETLADLWSHDQTPPAERAAVVWAWRCIMSTVLARHSTPGAPQKSAPVLVSPPDWGKTVSLEMLTPLGMHNRVTLAARDETARRDQAEKARSSVLLIADELAGLTKRSADEAKELWSASQDSYSPKYIRRTERVSRVCALAGTVNPGRRLPWAEGLPGRLILVRLPERPAAEGDVESMIDAQRDDLWAAAIWHHDHSAAWERGPTGLSAPAAVRDLSDRHWWSAYTTDGRKQEEADGATE